MRGTFLRSLQLMVLAGLTQGMMCIGRLPTGEHQHQSADSVWSSHECDKRSLPFLQIERNIVAPGHIEPGGELRHVLIYSMCPQSAGQPVRGRLHRRVVRGMAPIHDDVSENFELKPGRWVVIAFIGVPATAPGGGYALEVEFEAEQLAFLRTSDFQIER